jgi:hypothetical protein
MNSFTITAILTIIGSVLWELTPKIVSYRDLGVPDPLEPVYSWRWVTSRPLPQCWGGQTTSGRWTSCEAARTIEDRPASTLYHLSTLHGS